MGSKKSFVVYTAWKSFFELLDDPVLVNRSRSVLMHSSHVRSRLLSLTK